MNKQVDLLEGTFVDSKFWTIVIEMFFKINKEAPKGPKKFYIIIVCIDWIMDYSTLDYYV
jgi:hypothetical protein